MVEAAGVEPASERPVAAELYVRIRSYGFATGNKGRRMRRPLARMGLAQTTTGAVLSQPTKWRSLSSRRLQEANVANLVRPRAQAANPQLRCVSTGLTSEMNKLGTHSTAPCPRRSQIAPTEDGPRTNNDTGGLRTEGSGA